MSAPAIQPITPNYHLRILSDEQLSQLKAATFEILEEIGIHCPSSRVLNIYADHGANVDFDNKIVKIGPDIVVEALSHAPRYYTLGARSANFDLVLDGRSMYCATDGCGTESVDFVSGERRASNKEDVAKMARVSDYLSSMGFYWPIVSAQDFGPTAPLHELDASFNNTVKHVQTPTVVDEVSARYAIEMAQVVAGDSPTMRARPPLSSLICTIAPLAQDKEAMEAALLFAEAGLPVGFMSMATGGSTAPASIAGTVAVGDAEIVSAMVLVQMAYPSAPVYYSLMPGIMHPRTGGFMGSGWEADMFYPIGVELAHMWGVPSLAGVGTGADSSSWESAVGIASNMLLCALCGAETGSGFGLREDCTLLTPEALVLDSEFYHQVRTDAAGLDTCREAIAMEVIREVGPGGHYLTQRHTRDQMRLLEFSDLISQPSKEGGYRNPIDVAREKTKWILENHEPEPLPEDNQAELNQILQMAQQELG